MIINFTEYKAKVKVSIVKRKGRLNFLDHPWDGSWLAYALSKDGAKSNILFSEAKSELLRWFDSSKELTDEREVGAAGILSYAVREAGEKVWEEIAVLVATRLSQLREKEFHKFSIFNNPELLFASVIGALPLMDNLLKEFVLSLSDKNKESTKLVRRLFYSAVIMEISPREIRLGDIDLNKVRIDEIIPLVWFVERYQYLCDASRDKVWDMFSKNRDILSMEGLELPSGLYELSALDLALLYESLAHETKAIDPKLLFANYPLHPRIKEACQSLFENGEYANAVFEAAKAYNDFVKERSEVRNKDGRPLMQSVFTLKNPILKVNPLATRSDRDEQEGIKLLSEGIISAIRNPKGHEPKDKIKLGPYEALDQIVVISLLATKVGKAEKA